MPIRYTHQEELWNSWSHAGGIVMGVAFGVIFLVMAFQGENPWIRLGVCLYLFGMLGSYVASTVYHSLPFYERTHRQDAQAGAGRSSLRVERTTAPLGPCCHLLAHCRLLLSADTHSTTHPRLLGLGTLLVRVAVCHCRHHHQFYPTEGAL